MNEPLSTDLRDDYRFCCNHKCIAFEITGIPDDELGPIEVRADDGAMEYTRALVVRHGDPNNAYWLCNVCQHAADIVTGRADPQDRPVNPQVISSLF